MKTLNYLPKAVLLILFGTSIIFPNLNARERRESALKEQTQTQPQLPRGNNRKELKPAANANSSTKKIKTIRTNNKRDNQRSNKSNSSRTVDKRKNQNNSNRHGSVYGDNSNRQRNTIGNRDRRRDGDKKKNANKQWDSSSRTQPPSSDHNNRYRNNNTNTDKNRKAKNTNRYGRNSGGSGNNSGNYSGTDNRKKNPEYRGNGQDSGNSHHNRYGNGSSSNNKKKNNKSGSDQYQKNKNRSGSDNQYISGNRRGKVNGNYSSGNGRKGNNYGQGNSSHSSYNKKRSNHGRPGKQYYNKHYGNYWRHGSSKYYNHYNKHYYHGYYYNHGKKYNYRKHHHYHYTYGWSLFFPRVLINNAYCGGYVNTGVTYYNSQKAVLFEHANYSGNSMTLYPGQSISNLEDYYIDSYTSFDNLISSATVAGNVTLVLYSGENFTGDSVYLHGNISDFDSDNILWPFNDGVSSLKLLSGRYEMHRYSVLGSTYGSNMAIESSVNAIMAVDSSDQAEVSNSTYRISNEQSYEYENQEMAMVILYDQPDYRGNELVLTPGMVHQSLAVITRENGSSWDNSIASIQIVGDAELFVYNDENFYGSGIALGHNVAGLSSETGLSEFTGSISSLIVRNPE